MAWPKPVREAPMFPRKAHADSRPMSAAVAWIVIMFFFFCPY